MKNFPLILLFIALVSKKTELESKGVDNPQKSYLKWLNLVKRKVFVSIV